MTAPNGDSATLRMRFLISEDGTTVSYGWTVTAGDTVVASHSAKFSL